MKKLLLTGAMLMALSFTANAQDSCDTALEISEAGTYTVDGIFGTYLGSCVGTAATAAQWYTITPTENSLIRINTNLEANVDAEADTRFSILSGDCAGPLNCVGAIDDIDQTNFLGDLTFQAVAGQTYFISFDDRWLDTGFDFEVTITPASCFSPEGFAYTEEGGATLTTASFEWAEPATSPEGYEFEYGNTGFDLGTGTSVTVTDAAIDLEDLTSGTDYDFYVRTNCGNGDYSEWAGPISFTTDFSSANLNYSYGFETANLNGWTTLNVNANTNGAAWQLSGETEDGFVPQEGETAFTAGFSAAASNNYLFSRGINVAAGQVVNISYYVRKYVGAGTGGVNNIGLTVGTDTTVAAQTVITAQTAVTSEDWTQRTATFTATNAGVYYFGFRYTGTAQSQANNGAAALDNVVFTSPTADVKDNSLAQFSVFPNPTSNVVNVNGSNALVNGVNFTDINGRTVKTVKFNGVTEAQVNISDLASGIYMMSISSDKGTTVKKIVKN